MASGAQRHWYGGATPPNVSSAPSSAHQLAGWFCASNVRSVKVRLTAVPAADASGSPAVFEYRTARPLERPFPQPTPFVLHGSSPYR